MKGILGSIGGLAVLLGAGSFILDMMNRQFSLLAWVDNWGPQNALYIRIALIIVGAILWLAARRMSDPVD